MEETVSIPKEVIFNGFHANKSFIRTLLTLFSFACIHDLAQASSTKNPKFAIPAICVTKNEEKILSEYIHIQQEEIGRHL